MIFTCSEEEKILVKRGPDDSLTLAPNSFRNELFFSLYKYSHLHKYAEEKFDSLQKICLHIQILEQKTFQNYNIPQKEHQQIIDSTQQFSS